MKEVTYLKEVDGVWVAETQKEKDEKYFDFLAHLHKAAEEVFGKDVWELHKNDPEEALEILLNK